MYQSIRFIVLLLCLITFGKICQAQNANIAYEFTPGDVVIFEDLFSQDSVSTFPSRWHFCSCNPFYALDTTNRPLCMVERDSSDHALLIRTNGTYLDPNIDAKFYLHDSFAVEFDFRFDSASGGAELVFYPYENPNPCLKERIQIWSTGQLRKDISSGSHFDKFLGRYPSPFLKKTWHHFALAYRKRAVDFYIDGNRVTALADCGFSPYGISIGSHNPVSYKHFRITTGNHNYDFDKILTDSKLVTHAINFDVNKWDIGPDGMAFVRQLAQFMKANPLIKLEIDGHTDIDGDADANMLLSQNRADEVKKQLVVNGIDGTRLLPKGYGITKPIKPNTTAEGKAENRRVEFILQ